MARVLVIEDDAATAEEILAELSGHGISADWARTGEEGLARTLEGNYDAVTLDRLLPGLDGLAVVTTLRQRGVTTPVLMISALSDVDERVRGLRAGGDDYLTKPFASHEMAARIEVMLRRNESRTPPVRLRVNDLELDLIGRKALRRGREIDLLPAEFRLLEYMMRNHGQVLTRTMIFEAVWGYHFNPTTNIIEVHVARMRKKIDGPGEPALIRTVRGSGYSLG
jgi:two-component system OmpR family response regulator